MIVAGGFIQTDGAAAGCQTILLIRFDAKKSEQSQSSGFVPPVNQPILDSAKSPEPLLRIHQHSSQMETSRSAGM